MSNSVKTISAGKSNQLLSQTKPILSEQHQRLQAKNAADLDLIDDLRTFIKVKCNIEKDYGQALIKLVSHHQKKYPQFAAENDSDVKSLYTAWKCYLEELDKVSKQRLAEFEQIASFCDQLSEMKSHKRSVAKRQVDHHLKKMQEELNQSITELDKHRKFYSDEEHVALKARDKDDKLSKKKAGIFSKLSDLQAKKEKASAQREATEIESTHARNEYLMSLSATNAHLHHFYTLDLPNIMKTMDDDALDKCRGFVLKLLQSESNSLTAYLESVQKADQLVQHSSADITNQYFLNEPSSACINDTLQIDFEPCDGDTTKTVSTEYNQDLALEGEITKWLSCYSKECRNLSRLHTQLVKCQNLQQQGHKTVEVRGTGQVKLEDQIDEIKQQIRKCDISKCKAYARLNAIRESGMEVQDLDILAQNIQHEMAQQANTLGVDTDNQPLSRTGSVRSSKLSDDGRHSAADRSYSDADNDNQTPEPDQYVRSSGDYDEDSDDRDLSTPAPQTNNGNYGGNQYDNGQNWADSGWGDDAAANWDTAGAADQQQYEEQPQQEAEIQAASYAAEQDYDQSGYDQDGYDQAEYGQQADSSYDQAAYADESGYQQEQANYDQSNDESATYAQVDGTAMVNKICRAAYAYQGQSEDELVLVEGEEVTVVAATDADWVTAQNSQGQVGYVPAAYLEIVGDAPMDQYEPQEQQSQGQAHHTNEQPATAEVQITTEPPPAESTEEMVKALYDYEATSGEEISFSEGEVFRVLDKSEDGWWLGEKDGVVGHFPSMMVEELDGDEEGAFGDHSGDTESEESEHEGSAVAPTSAPPSFAPPPQPIHLTPHQIVIMQATPVVESRAFGEEAEVSADDGIGEENSDNPDSENPVEVPVPTAKPPPPPSDFTLDEPPKRPVAEKNEEEASAAPADLPPPPPAPEEDDGGNDEEPEPNLPPPPPPPPPEEKEEEKEEVDSGGDGDGKADDAESNNNNEGEKKVEDTADNFANFANFDEAAAMM